MSLFLMVPTKGDRHSYIWRGIVKAKKHIKELYKSQLAEGGSSLWYHNWLGSGKLCDRVPFVHITETLLRLSDVWEGGRRNLSSMYTILPNQVKEEILAIQVPCAPNGRDALRWTETTNGQYTTTSAYSTLTETNDNVSFALKKIWKVKVSKKIRFFL